MTTHDPFKRCAVALLSLLIIAVAGLLLGFREANRHYERSLAHIRYLQANAADLHGQVVQLDEDARLNEKRYARIDFLEYQNAVFQRKFPDFSRIVDTTYNKSRLFGFHPNLIMAVMQVESGYNPLAISNVGAYGLMQVHYAVWKDELNIDKTRIFDIDYNIGLGLKILKQYYDLSGGDIRRALFLYNNGYKYQNSGYLVKVNSTLFEQDPETARRIGVSQ